MPPFPRAGSARSLAHIRHGAGGVAHLYHFRPVPSKPVAVQNHANGDCTPWSDHPPGSLVTTVAIPPMPHVRNYLEAAAPGPPAGRAFDAPGRATTRQRSGRSVEVLACSALNHACRAGPIARRHGPTEDAPRQALLGPFAQDGGLRVGSAVMMQTSAECRVTRAKIPVIGPGAGVLPGSCSVSRPSALGSGFSTEWSRLRGDSSGSPPPAANAHHEFRYVEGSHQPQHHFPTSPPAPHRPRDIGRQRLRRQLPTTQRLRVGYADWMTGHP
jgi:hypothetical protein